jgi:predicted DNA-binding transcriptional regulator YafY
MPPVPAARHFEIVCSALALAEERGGVPLAEAAAATGTTIDELRRLLEPVLYLEYRTSDLEVIDESRAFLIDEDGLLCVEEGHWLRELRARPPDPGAALRLLISAVVYQASAERPSPALDTAIRKLRELVAGELHVPLAQPPCLAVARKAERLHRSLRFRYVKWKDASATDREVLPYLVFGKWGNWYVSGPEVGDDTVKEWRIDRMDEAEVGDPEFDPPIDVEAPDWLDMSEHERTLTVRVPADILPLLPHPHRIEQQVDEPDGFVRATVSVTGDRQLDHLLVALGPEGTVVRGGRLGARRAAAAQALLDQSREHAKEVHI